jgi:hypothetical protein
VCAWELEAETEAELVRENVAALEARVVRADDEDLGLIWHVHENKVGQVYRVSL